VTSITLKIPAVPGYVFSDTEDTSFWCLLFIENIYHTYKRSRDMSQRYNPGELARLTSVNGTFPPTRELPE
jgi:hypothetical protein